MDGQLYTILGAISSLLFGLYVCLVDFETFHGPGKWREFLGLAISLLIVYLSSVVAVRGYPWSFMFGAGVIALVIVLLLARYIWGYWRRRAFAQRCANMCPEATWDESTTFPCIQSVFCTTELLTLLDCHPPLWRHRRIPCSSLAPRVLGACLPQPPIAAHMAKL